MDERPHVFEGVLFNAVTRRRAETVPSSLTHSTCSMKISRGPNVAKSIFPELSKAPAKCPVHIKGFSTYEHPSEGTASCCLAS